MIASIYYVLAALLLLAPAALFTDYFNIWWLV
jgi:hypothetical protein